VKSSITISLVPQSRGGPFVFHDNLANGCEKAAALGFDAVEIFPLEASAIDIAQLSALLTQHKLKVAAVGSGAGWVAHKLSLTQADASIRSKARGFIRDIIDLAARFGAPAIIGSTQGRWEGDVSRGQALEWLGEGLAELGAHAATKGQNLLYEPLNRFETNLFNRVGDAATYLDTLQTRNLRILADLFHMNIEEASIADAFRANGRYIGHIHFVDSNRQAVGFGHTEMAPIFEALRAIGYQGYLSGEVLPMPDPETAARQTIESFRRFNT
jgi:sugar phosphate isomerase/epimerase